LPASSFDTSRMSLMSPKRCSPLARMSRRSRHISRCRRAQHLARNDLRKPDDRIERSAQLVLYWRRIRSLVRFVSSACSLAAISSRSARLRSVMSTKTVTTIRLVSSCRGKIALLVSAPGLAVGIDDFLLVRAPERPCRFSRRLYQARAPTAAMHVGRTLAVNRLPLRLLSQPAVRAAFVGVPA